LSEPLEQIVLRCKAGEKASFEWLFEQYQPRLKYYLRRLDETGTNSDDHLQEIWITVLRKIHTLQNSELFPVWLYRIARNCVYSGFRRKQRFARLPEDHEIPVSDNNEPTFHADDAEKLHRALDTLKPQHREVLTLSFMEQMSYQSIAEVIGCSIGTVRSRLFYAKQSLRREMERQHGSK